MENIFKDARKRTFLVTGASGFLGKQIVKYILSEGAKVHGFDMRMADEYKSEIPGFSFERVNLTQPYEFPSGITDVIHAAGKVSDWGSYQSFYDINVTATEKLMGNANEKGVKNFLFISSIDIHGFYGHIDETEEGVYYESKCFYPQTKMIAEKIVRNFDSKDMKTVCIRPCTVYGPGDTTVQGPMMDAILKRQMGYISKGKLLISRVYVDDLVQGLCKALERGKGGEAYNIVSGEKITWKEWVEEIAKGLGVKPPSFSAPYPLAYAIAATMESLYKLVKAKNGPLLTRMRIKHAGHNFSFIPEKAIAELGFSPKTEWKDGVKLMVEAYLKEKNS